MIERFIISRDLRWHHAFPDVTLTVGGKLVCVFAECTHHGDRSHTRILLSDSDDRGRSWSACRGRTKPTSREIDGYMWNCPRISTLSDGRLVAVCDRVTQVDEADHSSAPEQSNWLWFSDDGGPTWTGPHPTPVVGIVPDQLIELKHGKHAGRWLLGAHTRTFCDPSMVGAQRLWYTDDHGNTWRGPITIAQHDSLWLCEGSTVELPTGELVCFLRESSGSGLDCHKTISIDGGDTWSEPVRCPLPACHRPVAGMLRSGRLLITHRFMQGGKGWVGWWAQNRFAALTDAASALSTRREQAHTRIMPLDSDRSPKSDTGYTGWVQFDDGEVYATNYIVDDHHPLAQIRGYAFDESDLALTLPTEDRPCISAA